MAGFGDLRQSERTAELHDINMQDFTKSFGFIVVFIVLLLLISLTIGDKVIHPFLLLVLFGMMITNWSTFENLFRRYSV